jgi:triphosphoribosyl-dephospho-CoA synthetase
MEDNSEQFIKADDNKILNKNSILWVKKLSECLEVCVSRNGCTVGKNTHKICKINNETSYENLNKYFE